MAALGKETKEGDFEVYELLYAGLPEQPPRKAEAKSGEGEWVALLSGLALGGTEASELKGALLAEWLTGELGGEEDGEDAVKVTRLILAGNSLAQPREDEGDDKKPVSHPPQDWATAARVADPSLLLCRRSTATTPRYSRPSLPRRSTLSSSFCCRL